MRLVSYELFKRIIQHFFYFIAPLHFLKCSNSCAIEVHFSIKKEKGCPYQFFVPLI